MAQIIKEIRVDVSQPCNLQAILAKQYDCNSRFLKITLTDCGTKIDVPNTSKVTINTNRPDGQSKSFNGDANTDGTVTVPLPQWSLSVVGDLKCDVSVTDTSTNERLTTMDIWVNVIEAANDNTDISENPDGEITVITPSRVIDENSTDDEYPSAKTVYDYGQSILADTKVIATASGSAITIESANAPIPYLKLSAKTTQDGTPTLTSPIELKSVGDSGSFSVGVYGKNLFNNTATTTTLNGVTYTVNADKSVTAVGTASVTTTFNMGEFRNLIKGATYKTLGGLCCRLQLKDGTRKYVNSYQNFIYTDDIDRIFAYMSVGVGQTVNSTIYPMLVLNGVTDETYEQYKVQTLTMPYTLRGVGEVKDEIDFARGVKIQRHRKINARDFSWTVSAVSNGKYGITTSTVPSNIKKPLNDVTLPKVVCNICTEKTASQIWSLDEGITIWTNSRLMFYLADYNTSDITAWNNYIASNDVEIIYPLETPIETPLTETELNAYRQLMTNSGNTTILSEADMTLDYYTPKGQVLGNIHTQVNKDYLKMQQAITQL